MSLPLIRAGLYSLSNIVQLGNEAIEVTLPLSCGHAFSLLVIGMFDVGVLFPVLGIDYRRHCLQKLKKVQRQCVGSWTRSDESCFEITPS